MSRIEQVQSPTSKHTSKEKHERFQTGMCLGCSSRSLFDPKFAWPQVNKLHSAAIKGKSINEWTCNEEQESSISEWMKKRAKERINQRRMKQEMNSSTKNEGSNACCGSTNIKSSTNQSNDRINQSTIAWINHSSHESQLEWSYSRQQRNSLLLRQLEQFFASTTCLEERRGRGWRAGRRRRRGRRSAAEEEEGGRKRSEEKRPGTVNQSSSQAQQSTDHRPSSPRIKLGLSNRFSKLPAWNTCPSSAHTGRQFNQSFNGMNQSNERNQKESYQSIEWINRSTFSTWINRMKNESIKAKQAIEWMKVSGNAINRMNQGINHSMLQSINRMKRRKAITQLNRSITPSSKWINESIASHTWAHEYVFVTTIEMSDWRQGFIVHWLFDSSMSRKACMRWDEMRWWDEQMRDEMRWQLGRQDKEWKDKTIRKEGKQRGGQERKERRMNRRTRWDERSQEESRRKGEEEMQKHEQASDEQKQEQKQDKRGAADRIGTSLCECIGIDAVSGIPTEKQKRTDRPMKTNKKWRENEWMKDRAIPRNRAISRWQTNIDQPDQFRRTPSEQHSPSSKLHQIQSITHSITQIKSTPNQAYVVHCCFVPSCRHVLHPLTQPQMSLRSWCEPHASCLALHHNEIEMRKKRRRWERREEEWKMNLINVVAINHQREWLNGLLLSVFVSENTVMEQLRFSNFESITKWDTPCSSPSSSLRTKNCQTISKKQSTWFRPFLSTSQAPVENRSKNTSALHESNTLAKSSSVNTKQSTREEPNASGP